MTNRPTMNKMAPGAASRIASSYIVLLEYYGKRNIEGLCPKCLSRVKIDLQQHEDGYFDCPICGYHFEIERLETEDNDRRIFEDQEPKRGNNRVDLCEVLECPQDILMTTLCYKNSPFYFDYNKYGKDIAHTFSKDQILRKVFLRCK